MGFYWFHIPEEQKVDPEIEVGPYTNVIKTLEDEQNTKERINSRNLVLQDNNASLLSIFGERHLWKQMSYSLNSSVSFGGILMFCYLAAWSWKEDNQDDYHEEDNSIKKVVPALANDLIQVCLCSPLSWPLMFNLKCKC